MRGQTWRLLLQYLKSLLRFFGRSILNPSLYPQIVMVFFFFLLHPLPFVTAYNIPKGEPKFICQMEWYSYWGAPHFPIDFFPQSHSETFSPKFRGLMPTQLARLSPGDLKLHCAANGVCVCFVAWRFHAKWSIWSSFSCQILLEWPLCPFGHLTSCR